MKKRMLADVLWEAANVHLWDGMSEPQIEDFSCLAVKEAVHLHTGAWGPSNETEEMQFLEGLGCDFVSACDTFFALFDTKEERQGVRYMWLLIAMHVAEDEGIEL